MSKVSCDSSYTNVNRLLLFEHHGTVTGFPLDELLSTTPCLHELGIRRVTMNQTFSCRGFSLQPLQQSILQLTLSSVTAMMLHSMHLVLPGHICSYSNSLWSLVVVSEHTTFQDPRWT